MFLSIVFSFRNEEENLERLVRRVAGAVEAIPDIRYEFIFVNDDSTDQSLSILVDLQKNFPITIVNMSRRFGVTPCVLAGFAQSRGDAVVYMDADLQDPPEIIPEMIRVFTTGAEVVHTTRTHREGEGPFKMWLTRKAYRLINRFSDIHLPENTGDFKLLSRKVVDEILRLKEYDPYMRGLSVWVGYRQDFVYYQRESRWKGQTKFPLLSRGPMNEFTRGLTAFSAAPLYLSLFFGALTSVLAFGLILYAVVTKITGSAVPGVSGVLIAVAFFSGIILITNGVLGVYVARIYNEVKGRPQYIIKDVRRPHNAQCD
ncbi:MAG: glycosyltransferase family 2 protein [Nitrospirales bacterium]